MSSVKAGAAANAGGGKRKRAGGVGDKTFEQYSIEELSNMWVAAQADMKQRTKQNTQARKSLKTMEAVLAGKMLEASIEAIDVGEKRIVRSKALSLADGTGADQHEEGEEGGGDE
jgi:hypothetical protein